MKVNRQRLVHNALYWVSHIQDVFLPQISVLRETIKNRLLPTFQRLSEEAETISEETWRRFMRSTDPDSDPAHLAESAHEAGIDHFLMMNDTRQSLINLFAVAIHHLVEQQMLFLLRRELLPIGREDEHSLIKLRVFLVRLTAADIDPRSLAGWTELEELRDIANAVKHAEGPAVATLRKRRPDLWLPPSLLDDARSSSVVGIGKVYQPLSGHDIYVTPADLDRYFDGAEKFWHSLQGELQRITP